MKTSDQHLLGYLKLVFGRLPLKPFLNEKERMGALDIGEFTIEANTLIQSAREDDAVFDYLVDWCNQETNERLAKLEAFEQSIPSEIQYRFDCSIFDKRRSLKKISSIEEKRLEYLAHTPLPDEKKDSLSQFKSQIALYTEEFLCTLDAETFFFGSKGFKTLFPFGNRQRHTYILGGSGSGKTEFLKLFIWSDIQQKKGSLVIDAHGDLSRDISKFKCPDDRILYLSPEYGGKFGYYFRFNPFDHAYHDKPAREKQAFISVKSQELLNAFAIVMNTEFSEQMKRIVFNILQVLLNHKGMKLKDFLMFLRSATSEPYEQLAAQHYNENVRLFFAHDFNQRRLEITKSSVLTRFENALSNYHLAQIFDCETSSFALQKSLNQGKCILLNCSQGILGEQGSKMLGSFLFSELTTLALQRATIPEQFRKPWMLYIDECQNYVTERVDKVLAEARKYGFHLTLANQFINQIENVRLRSSILANTNIKCVGFCSYKDYELLSKEMNYKNKTVPKLGKGRFIIKVGSYEPLVIQAYDFLVDTNGKSYLSKEKHRKRLNQNLRNYYTKSVLKKHKTVSEQSQTTKPIVSLPKPAKLL